MAHELAVLDAIPADVAAEAAKHSIWSRMAAAFIASRQRKADSAIERYILANGGQLTDALERDISRRFGHMAGDR